MGHLWLNEWGIYDLDECGSYGNLAICSNIAGIQGNALSRY